MFQKKFATCFWRLFFFFTTQKEIHNLPLTVIFLFLPIKKKFSQQFLPFYRYERNTIMSTLRQRNALRKLVNPGQSDDESNQSGQSGQSSQSNKNKRKNISARKNEVLVRVFFPFFKPIYRLIFISLSFFKLN